MLRSPRLSRVNNVLVFTILTGVILYFGREFFILLVFAGFFAMLMTPLSNWLERRRFKRVLSTIISIAVLIVIISAIVFLLSAQIVNMVQEIPKIRSEVSQAVNAVSNWLYNQFGVDMKDPASNLKEHASEAIGTAGNFLAGVVKGAFRFVGSFLLVVVFTFLFLYNREKYKRFVVMINQPDKQDHAAEVITTISKIAHHYLIGRMMAIFIIAVLLITGFILIGLKNGVLLGAIAGLVAIIPYVGPLLGGMIPFIMAIIDGSSNQGLWVVIIVLIVNMLDHYFIEPYIVGGSINISPFFTILVLVVGGAFWGIAGIILFLPLLGILKIILENVDGLQPYAYLIGDGEDSSAPGKLWGQVKGVFKRNKKNR
ncbi:MAG TPA: AI-2E family transporter [Bacteroidales bacterium]|nr:AI-2E family transporter [Bacteroidales bacterium]